MGDKTKRRFKRFDGLDQYREHYGRSLDRAPVEVAPPKRNLIPASTIARLASVAVTTPGRLAKSNMIPRPVEYSAEGQPLWDADDKRLKEWIFAMQRSQRK